MKKVIFLVLLSIGSIQNILCQSYKIDAGHSNVQIQVERFGVIDVVGRFKDVSGSISYNGDHIPETAAQAVIQVDSYDANNAGGEEAVKSKAFLDAVTFPEITFVAKEAIIKNEETFLIGDLTIHGETNSIELPFSVHGPLLDLPTQKQSVALSASTTINRQDYGVSFDRKLPNGTPIVGNDIKITLQILAIAE